MAALETDMVCWIRIYDQHKCVNVIYILKFIVLQAIKYIGICTALFPVRRR